MLNLQPTIIMMQNFMLVPVAVMLITYCYTVTMAHVLLARVDRLIPVPRTSNGAITLKGLVLWSASSFHDTQPLVNRSIKLLKLANSIAALFIVMVLLVAMVTPQDHQSIITIANNFNR